MPKGKADKHTREAEKNNLVASSTTLASHDFNDKKFLSNKTQEKKTMRFLQQKKTILREKLSSAMLAIIRLTKLQKQEEKKHLKTLYALYTHEKVCFSLLSNYTIPLARLFHVVPVYSVFFSFWCYFRCSTYTYITAKFIGGGGGRKRHTN